MTQTGDLDCNNRTLTITISAHVQRQGDPFPDDATVTVDAPQHMTFEDGSTEQTYDLNEGETLTITFILIPGPYASTAAGRAKSNYSRAYPFIVHLRDCPTAQVETPTATPGIVGGTTAPTATTVPGGTDVPTATATVVPGRTDVPTATATTVPGATDVPTAVPTVVLPATVVAPNTPTAPPPAPTSTAQPTRRPTDRPPAQPTSVPPPGATAAPTSSPPGDTGVPPAQATAVPASGTSPSTALGPAGQPLGPLPITLPVTGAALDQRSLLLLLTGLMIVLVGLTLSRRRRTG